MSYTFQCQNSEKNCNGTLFTPILWIEKRNYRTYRSNNCKINENMETKTFLITALAIIFNTFAKVMKDLLGKSTTRCKTPKHFRLPILRYGLTVHNN